MKLHFFVHEQLKIVKNCIAVYYMPSTFYIVKLPLAHGNFFHLTTSILAQSHDNAKYPYWGIKMDF